MANKKRVLVIRCGALGDLVYATSVIDALKYEYGEEITIDFICTPNTSSLFDNDKRINNVFPLKHKKIPIWLSSQKKFIIKVSNKNPYDLLINFEYGKQFKSLIENINAKEKIGALIDNIKIPTNLTHVVDTTKYIFKKVVSEEVFNKSFPHLYGSDSSEMRKKYNLPENYIIISPSNSHQKRNIINYRAWENSSWKNLINKLSKDIQIVVVGNRGRKNFLIN